MPSRRPRALTRGSRIRVVAPAGRVSRERLEQGVLGLQGLGFEVSLAEHIWHTAGYLAGTDEMRARDLEEALVDESVDAVFLARGGWGTLRALPLLDAERIARATPKVVLGYSDITALHGFLNGLGWVTFHGPVVEMDWTSENGIEALRIVGGGSGFIGDSPMEHLWQSEDFSGPLTTPWVGGNLSVFCASLKTPFEVDVRDKVLYLEEVQEPPYRIDRMMTQLRLAGVLSQACAIVFGEATRCQGDPELADYGPRDVVMEQCRRAGVDLFWGLPAGHGVKKLTVPMGWPLSIEDGWVRLTEAAVGS